MKLSGKGWWGITGIAWSGRGKIVRVDVSTDGGNRWEQAELDEPVLPECHTRFRLPWNWDGEEAVLVSRATDPAIHGRPWTSSSMCAASARSTISIIFVSGPSERMERCFLTWTLES